MNKEVMALFPVFSKMAEEVTGSSWKGEGHNLGMYWFPMWNLQTIRLAVCPVVSSLENKETYENNRFEALRYASNLIMISKKGKFESL